MRHALSEAPQLRLYRRLARLRNMRRCGTPARRRRPDPAPLPPPHPPPSCQAGDEVAADEEDDEQEEEDEAAPQVPCAGLSAAQRLARSGEVARDCG